MKRLLLLIICATFITTACKKVTDILTVKAIYNANAFTEKNCDQLGTVKSINSNTAVNITFVNNSKRQLHINWLDYNGAEQHYKDLEDGQSWICPTFLTHPWIIRKTDNACATILIPKAGATSSETVSFGER
jgi:5'-3' exonuclease